MGIVRTPEIDYFYKALTSKQIEDMSDGKIKQMSPAAASGLIGSWIIETGKRGLKGLDVVEAGAGQGRGLSQYTGPRREAYDKARSKALNSGIDPNTPEWQLRYFVEEYQDKHNLVPGESLSGWTRIFSRVPRSGTPSSYADFFTGSEAEGRGYFRPRVTHLQDRQKAAETIYQLYGTKPPAPPKPPAPETAKKQWWESLKIPFLN